MKVFSKICSDSNRNWQKEIKFISRFRKSSLPHLLHLTHLRTLSCSGRVYVHYFYSPLFCNFCIISADITKKNQGNHEPILQTGITCKKTPLPDCQLTQNLILVYGF